MTMTPSPLGPPITRLLPNAVTVLALCAGLSSVRFILIGDEGAAVLAIVIAAVLDAVDGRLARMLHATSRMGAELDSLADAVSFGVAPALVLHTWALGGHPAGWLVALAFVICMILRLARFNSMIDAEDQPTFTKEFFTGVPAPAAALLALLPLIITQQDGPGWWGGAPVVAVWTGLVALLAVSRVPTMSVKRLRVGPGAVTPAVVLLTALVAGALVAPWAVLATALVVYLGHIPFAVRRYRWLAAHPEAWDAGPGQRRALRRQHRAGGRPLLSPRVSGKGLRLRPRPGAGVRPPATTDRGRRDWRRLGLRRVRPARDQA